MKKYISYFLVVFLVLLGKSISAQNYQLLIGTYTSTTSEGIYVYNFNSDSGTSSYVNKVQSSNPSFLSLSKNNKFVYAVNENTDSSRFTKSGFISAFSLNKKKGILKEINKEESGGKHPCHVTIDNTGKWLVASNYSSGSFAILGIQKNGKLKAANQVIQDTGKSIVKGRQGEPHAHSAFFSVDNKKLFAQDLGIDKIMVFDFDSNTGIATPAKQPYIATKAGAGPRHLDFHPNGRYIYVIEELSNTVNVLMKNETNEYNSIQTISSVPSNYTGPAGSADIHISSDGKFLYTSNRGSSNTIGIFSVDEATGKLTVVAHQSTMGKMPRNFSLDPTENYLFVANQQSNNIVIFRRDKQSGLLTYSGNQYTIPNPVCLKFSTGN